MAQAVARLRRVRAVQAPREVAKLPNCSPPASILCISELSNDGLDWDCEIAKIDAVVLDWQLAFEFSVYNSD